MAQWLVCLPCKSQESRNGSPTRWFFWSHRWALDLTERLFFSKQNGTATKGDTQHQPRPPYHAREHTHTLAHSFNTGVLTCMQTCTYICIYTLHPNIWKDKMIKKLDMIDFTALKQIYLFLLYHQGVGSLSALAYIIILIFNDTLLIVLQ